MILHLWVGLLASNEVITAYEIEIVFKIQFQIISSTVLLELAQLWYIIHKTFVHWQEEILKSRDHFDQIHGKKKILMLFSLKVHFQPCLIF